MKLGFFRQILEKYSNVKFQKKSVQWKPSCPMRTDGQTDSHGEANSRFPQFCEDA
jgi:hypothetical protein